MLHIYDCRANRVKFDSNMKQFMLIKCYILRKNPRVTVGHGVATTSKENKWNKLLLTHNVL